MASISRFFYDWNVDFNGFIWPGNIFKDTKRAYVRSDYTDNDNINDVDEADLDIVFNAGTSVTGSSGDNMLHEDTYLMMQHFEAGYESYANNKKFWLVYPGVRTYDSFTNKYVDIIKTGAWLSAGAQNGTQRIYIYDVGQKQIVGIDKTENVQAGNANCHLGNLRHTDEDGWYFLIAGKKYSLYSHSLDAFIDAVDIGSLAVWSDQYELMMLLPNSSGLGKKFEWTNVFYDMPDLTRPYDETENWRKVSRHENEIVALFATVPEADHINIYTTNSSGLVTSTDYYKSKQLISTFNVWTRNISNAQSVSSSGTVDDILDEALFDATKAWMTPTEFYNKQSTSTNGIKTGAAGYAKANDTGSGDKLTIPVWFWVNTLANWCTFKHGERHCTKLCVWNGRNGWDALEDIMRPLSEARTVLSRYYYDITRFTRGTKIFSKLYYNGSRYQYKSIKLPYDSKFSQYDETSFQCIKIGRVHLDDRGTQRYPFTTGIPPIMRLPSGELSLIYYLILPGMTKKHEVIYQDQIDFINSVCQAYFGKGDEKTINDDWKRFYRLKDALEETANDIVTDDESTLVDAEEINTIHENNALMNVTLSIPRQYPETIDTAPDSYVEDWRQ